MRTTVLLSMMTHLVRLDVLVIETAKIEEFLEQLEAPVTAAELHGLVTGALCAGGDIEASERLTLFSNWLDIEIRTDEAEPVDQLVASTLDSLGDFGDEPFDLLLPDLDEPINDRGQAVVSWCGAFLSGFGTRINQSDVSENVSEILLDFAEIAKLEDEELVDDEANEADLMEVHEYIRISTQLIFSEYGQVRVTSA